MAVDERDLESSNTYSVNLTIVEIVQLLRAMNDAAAEFGEPNHPSWRSVGEKLEALVPNYHQYQGPDDPIDLRR